MQIDCNVQRKRIYDKGMKTSEKIVRTLADRGISIRELARRCGITETATRNIVNGTTDNPDAKKIFLISAWLSLPLRWLLDDRQDWPPPSPVEDALDVLAVAISSDAWDTYVEGDGEADTDLRLANVAIAVELVNDLLEKKQDCREVEAMVADGLPPGWSIQDAMSGFTLHALTMHMYNYSRRMVAKNRPEATRGDAQS